MDGELEEAADVVLALETHSSMSHTEIINV